MKLRLLFLFVFLSTVASFLFAEEISTIDYFNGIGTVKLVKGDIKGDISDFTKMPIIKEKGH